MATLQDHDHSPSKLWEGQGPGGTLSMKLEDSLTDIDMSQVCHYSFTFYTLQQLSRVTQEVRSKTKDLTKN